MTAKGQSTVLHRLPGLCRACLSTRSENDKSPSKPTSDSLAFLAGTTREFAFAVGYYKVLKVSITLLTAAEHQPAWTRAQRNRNRMKQLTDARHDFKAYLEKSQVPGHYLSVSSPKAPLRRTDGIEVTSLAQLAIIRNVFTWDDVQSRWIGKDGGRIVTEDEIYDVILSFQRGHPNTR